MPLLNPNASFDVAAENPTQVVDYTQISRTIGAYAEDYMAAKASNANAALNSDLLAGLRTVKALRADGKEAEAQAAETNIFTNFISRGGELSDPNVQAMSMSVIGKPSEAWGQSQQEYQMNLVRNSPEYQSALTATYATISADATAEERDAAAFAIISKAEGNAAILSTGSFEWNKGGRDLFLDNVKQFEDGLLGSVIRAGQEGTPITLAQLNEANAAFQTYKTELYARRPVGVSNEDWSIIEDRMKATEGLITFLTDTKMPEMVNAEVLSNMTEAIKASDAFGPSRKNALIAALNADPTRALEWNLFGNQDDLVRELGSVMDELPDPRRGTLGTRLSPGQLRDPEVYDLQVSENEKDYTPTQFFEMGRGAFNAANVASSGDIESNVELREEWARMLTKGMARISVLSSKGEFMTADQYEYMFGSDFRNNMNRIKTVDPQLYNALAARAQEALTNAGIALNAKVNSGLFGENGSPFEYNIQTKTFRITEASARNATPPPTFDRLKSGVDKYYGGDWDAALADRGKAFVEPSLFVAWTSLTKTTQGGVPSELTDAANGIDIVLRTQTALSEELGKAAVENLQLSSKNAVPSYIDYAAPLSSTLIDRYESAGGYDTLLGHTDRSGSEFGSTRVSQMTVGEAIQFAAEGGQYSEYSKEWKRSNRHGDSSVPSTPMGRYQFVGSTLADIVKRYNIDPNITFDAQTQDALFLLYAKDRIGNKHGAAARQALTEGWAGLRKASASDLDQMVAEIRAAETPDLGGSAPQTASSVSTPAVETSKIDDDYSDLVTSAGLPTGTQVSAQFPDEAAAQAALDSGQIRVGQYILIGSGDTAQLIEVT